MNFTGVIFDIVPLPDADNKLSSLFVQDVLNLNSVPRFVVPNEVIDEYELAVGNLVAVEFSLRGFVDECKEHGETIGINELFVEDLAVLQEDYEIEMGDDFGFDEGDEVPEEMGA